MINIKMISLAADELWLCRINKHLELTTIDLKGSKKIVGAISTKTFKSGQLDYKLQLEITIKNNNPKYKIQISGSLKNWYYGNNDSFLTKSDLDKSLTLLSQRLFIKKKTLLEAKISSISFCCDVNFNRNETNLYNWIFQPNKANERNVKTKSTCLFVEGKNKLFFQKQYSNLKVKTVRFVYSTPIVSNQDLLEGEITTFRQLNLKWNLLVIFFIREIHKRFNTKTADYLSEFRKKMSSQSSTLKVVLTYEEEFDYYMKNLPSTDLIDVYTEDKCVGVLSSFKIEFEDALKMVKSPLAIKRLKYRISQINKTLKSLNSRTESQKQEDDENYELIQLARYGQDYN